jgi:hypothetical protein
MVLPAPLHAVQVLSPVFAEIGKTKKISKTDKTISKKIFAFFILKALRLFFIFHPLITPQSPFAHEKACSLAILRFNGF